MATGLVTLTTRKVLGVTRIPSSVIVCATVVIALEIVGVFVNVESGRDIGQFISWLATINGVLVAGVGILARVESGNQQVDEANAKVDRVLNGDMDEKLKAAIHAEVPKVLSAWLSDEATRPGTSKRPTGA